jgi:hypothetical protein
MFILLTFFSTLFYTFDWVLLDYTCLYLYSLQPLVRGFIEVITIILLIVVIFFKLGLPPFFF